MGARLQGRRCHRDWVEAWRSGGRFLSEGDPKAVNQAEDF